MICYILCLSVLLFHFLSISDVTKQHWSYSTDNELDIDIISSVTSLPATIHSFGILEILQHKKYILKPYKATDTTTFRFCSLSVKIQSRQVLL